MATNIELLNKIEKLEEKFDTLLFEVGKLCGTASQKAGNTAIIRWVVFPLIVVLGGLIGLNIADVGVPGVTT